MAYEQRDNSGSIFRNQKKTEENHPNGQGKCMVGGVTYYISSWVKTDKNGHKWQSLSFKDVDEVKAKPAQKKQIDGDNAFKDFEDDIPF